MTNLEELTLHLFIIRIDKNHVDGIQLHDDILIFMPRLNKFIFSFDTAVVKVDTEITFPSNEEMQRSFSAREYGLVHSHVEVFSREKARRVHRYSDPHNFDSRCYIYSHPYQFNVFFHLNNSFQGDMFNSVQALLITDFRPFEHSFFEVISQSFPLLKELHLSNDEAQKAKRQSKRFFIFSHLICLNLNSAHVDYAEQFLTTEHCHLPRLSTLKIRYESLALVTNNFTNDATRVTCAKLTSILLTKPCVPSENFHQYFPLL